VIKWPVKLRTFF